MSHDDASKWNERYAHADATLPALSRILSQGARWLPEPSAGLSALDLACGRAANAQWLASKGFITSAWDISDSVIDAIRNRQPALIHDIAVRDVSKNPPDAATFDVIVVCRFLDRALCPAIAAALKPGGTLFYQTFTHGLSNPDYLLAPNELLSLFNTLDILEYHEPEPDSQGRAEARLIARQSSQLSSTAP